MEFSGTFELEDTTLDEVWLAMSDPELIRDSLPGCQFLVRVDDEDVDFDALREEHAGEEPDLTADPEVIRERAFEEGATYAALIEVSVGSVSPGFETIVTVDRREKPEMAASGEGSAGNSSFEGSSRMELSEIDDGVRVDWEADADVFGRIAQMGQRVINPVANRVTKRFFQSIQETLRDLSLDDEADGGDDAGRTGPAETGPTDDDLETTGTGAGTGAESGTTETETETGTGPTEDAAGSGEAEAASTEGGSTGAHAPTDAGPAEPADRDATGRTAGEEGSDRGDDGGGIVARLRRLLGMG